MKILVEHRVRGSRMPPLPAKAAEGAASRTPRDCRCGFADRAAFGWVKPAASRCFGRLAIRLPWGRSRLVRAVALMLFMAALVAQGGEARGGQFLGFGSFAGFDRSVGQRPGETVLTSPEIPTRVAWDELIASWNLDRRSGTYLKVEARAVYPDRPTRYYVMGLYSRDPALHPRESVAGQKDADGDVSTDTLILQKACRRVQVRLTLGGEATNAPGLKFFSLCLTDSQASPPALIGNPAAWGKVMSVPERSQLSYSNGNVLCSPTTVSMLMSYWAAALKRPELDQDVPFVVKEVFDPVWKGTGNWAFNMAYAGSYPGMRACVSRFSGLAELEDWIAAGLPVGLSVCFDRLNGKDGGPPNGHLVVCIGFTAEGDVILNDPARLHLTRRTVARKTLIHAWSVSKNAVYLIYPEQAKLPADRFGHWD